MKGPSLYSDVGHLFNWQTKRSLAGASDELHCYHNHYNDRDAGGPDLES